MDESNLPLGILLLGIAGLAGALAFRPWPVDPKSTSDPQGPLSPVVYVVEILQGHPPSPSNPPDHTKNVAKIEGGLLTLIGVWVTYKLAGAVSGLGSLGNLGGGGGGKTVEDLGSKSTGILKDVEEAGGTVIKDVIEKEVP